MTPLVMTHSLLLKMAIDQAIEIVSFPINSMVIFHMLVYPRVMRVVDIFNGHFRNLKWRYLPYIRPYMVQYLHFRILKFPLIS
jgi:hypothetical protein